MPIKTAILGYGRSGSTLHAGPIEKLDEFALTAVCDIDPAALDKAKARFNCRTYENYADMLKKEELDLIVIVTRSSQHAQMARDCLLAGKNVLVTKPWALNAAEAQSMIDASKDSGAKLLPWLPARWGSDLARLKELVAGGAVGRVFQIRRSEFTFGVRFDWQTERKFGGGYLNNWGPHLLDQPMLLAGSPARSAYAVMKRIVNPGDAEDMFYAVIQTQSGVTVVSEFNIGADGLPNWVVQGDRGTIHVYKNRIIVNRAVYPDVFDPSSYRNLLRVEVSEEEVEDKDRYGDEYAIYRHIADALYGRAPFPVPVGSALALTRLMDAIRQSAQSGQAVSL